MKFANTPSSITYIDLVHHKNKSFSPSDYKKISIKCKTKKISEIVDSLSKGNEVGSKNYLSIETNYIFIRTKSIKRYNNLLEIDKNEVVFLSQKTFEDKKKYLLKKDSILYTTGGDIGEVCINKTDIKGIISSHIIQINIKNEELRYYIFAILKSSFSKELIELFTPTGSIKGLDNFKMEYLENLILPFSENITIIKKISILTKSLINKEVELKNKFNKISSFIENELKENQLSNKFNYQMLSFNDLVEFNRFDTGLYTQKIKEIEFLIQNYKHGSQTIVNQGFYSVRGQNLQVSQIGKSVYTNSLKQGFYQLFLPTHISLYGTINKILFIGNSKTLLQVKKDDIIFGAEGFGKGRSFIPLNESGRFITNIHGTMLRHDNEKTYKKIFVKCMIDWFREKNLIDAYSVGGNGGSFSTKYWKVLKFPLFPKDKQKNIAKLYYNPSDDYLAHIVDFDIKNYMNIDNEVRKNSGILDLDEQIKTIRDTIDTEIKKMVG